MRHNRVAALTVLLALVLARPQVADGAELRPRAAQPSDRDLLGARAQLATDPAVRAASGGDVTADTLAIAAIRVEFVEDDDDDTTGNGRFDFSAGSPDALDPPPHDAAYFTRQLTALERYWETVSNGALMLEPTLFPPGDREAFQLPRQMRYYNPDTTQAALDIRLAEFFRDAVVAADPGVPFADFDVVMIFHAGVGQNIAVIDVPPSDLPSAFLSFRELKNALAPDDDDFQGIVVDDGASVVRDGFWAPETQVLPATDIRPQIDFSMLGIMTSLMGSQLGLPSLFNTDSGAPGIGRFGLMDQGAGNEAGRLPAAPCAWSRFFLGWEAPQVVQQGDGIELAASLDTSTAAPRLVLVPVDSREYFLIENRQRDLDGDGTFTLVVDQGTVLGEVSGEYDGAIPGSGIAIWHIDEEVIDRHIDDNRVNADFNHRGVDMEEADGVEDIGLRPNGGFGLAEDLFFDPNATIFGPRTHPPTITNRGQETHVSVSDVSTSGLTMTFDVAQETFVSGWPDSTTLALDGVSLAGGRVDTLPGIDGVEAAFFTTPDGQVCMTRAPQQGVLSATLGGAGRGMPATTRIEVPGPAFVPVVAAASDAGVTTYRIGESSLTADPAWSRPGVAIAPGTDVLFTRFATDVPAPVTWLVAAAEDGMLHAWNDGGDHPGLPIDLGGAPRSNLVDSGVPHGFGVTPEITAVVGRQLVSVQLDGVSGGATNVTLPPEIQDGPVWLVAATTGQFSNASQLFWIVEPAGMVHCIDSDGMQQPGWPRRTGERHDAPPAVADLRGDGSLDLIVSGEGRVWAFVETGALLEGWPAAIDTATVGVTIESGPIVADLDADGALDVAVASPRGGLFAFAASGARLSGWPLASGAANRGTPALIDVEPSPSQTAMPEITLTGDGGWLYGFDVTANPVEGAWLERGGRGRAFHAQLVSPGGGGNIPFLAESSVVAYPNPSNGPMRVRYELGGDAGAEVSLLILDATGRTVRTIATSGRSGTLNEIHWDGRDDDGDPVPSGVYVMRLSARGSGQSAEHMRTVAVTR